MAKSIYAGIDHRSVVSVVEGIPFNVFSPVRIDWGEVYLEWVKIIKKEGLE